MASILDFDVLLKNNKLFLTNLSTIFILGILIYHIQLYESSKLLVFEPLGDQETIFEYFYHILHPQKHIFRGKVCGSVTIRSWGMEYPIFSFTYHFVTAILEMSQERECIPKFSC